jgi:ubiquinone biosynthesis protein Coq4
MEELMEKSSVKTTLFQRLKLFWILLRLSRNPEKTNLVFDLSDLLFKMQAYGAAAVKLEADQSFRELALSRKLMPEINLQELAKYPEGTLGYTYARHMLDRGLSPDFYRAVEIVDHQTWSAMWFRQTHDLWHVVTGFDTDANSEVGLQAFMMSLLSMPLASLIVGITLIKATIKEPGNLGDITEKISRGVRLARGASPVLSYRWDLNWNKPLAEVRSELGLSL